MCFGVRDAITLALEHADAGPLTILGDLVHNPTVLNRLAAKGIAVAQDVAAVKTPTLMVTAHGTSERTIDRTRARAEQWSQPLPARPRRAPRGRGPRAATVITPSSSASATTSKCAASPKIWTQFDVVLDESDVWRSGASSHSALRRKPRSRLTSAAPGCLIRARFPQSDVRFIDTVCQPTKQRQNAAVEMARQSDVVIVVGGAPATTRASW